MKSSSISKKQLLNKCIELGITKCSSKNKSQLIDLINSKINNNLLQPQIIENDSEQVLLHSTTIYDNSQIIKLPNTRYQGSKKKIINTIYELLSLHMNPIHILDLFGGSSICSLYFQINNIEVTYNDILKFNSINAYGLLDNDSHNIPDEEDIHNIFIKNSNKCYDTFIYNTFKDVYYTDEENAQLDVFRENIKHYYNNTIKQKIMYYLLFQSLLSKRPYNLFHRKNLSMRTADVERNFGNKATLDKPFVKHMLSYRKELIKLYAQKRTVNTGITHIINMPYNELPSETLSQIDTVYIDPPYIKKNCKDSQYYDNYHFLEGFVNESWNTNIDYSTKHLKLKTSSKYVINDANKMFDDIIDRYSNKNIIISYNSNAYPSIQEIENKLKTRYATVITKYIDYNYALSTHKSQEVVILAIIT